DSAGSVREKSAMALKDAGHSRHVQEYILLLYLDLLRVDGVAVQEPHDALTELGVLLVLGEVLGRRRKRAARRDVYLL
uniref:hypothetical protein n=1 Tax=Salmonella enterica TaxID=28901 RepID=UPI0020C2802C